MWGYYGVQGLDSRLEGLGYRQPRFFVSILGRVVGVV